MVHELDVRDFNHFALNIFKLEEGLVHIFYQLELDLFRELKRQIDYYFVYFALQLF